MVLNISHLFFFYYHIHLVCLPLRPTDVTKFHRYMFSEEARDVWPGCPSWWPFLSGARSSEGCVSLLLHPYCHWTQRGWQGQILLHMFNHTHTHAHTPVYRVVVIIPSLGPDAAPQLAGGQFGPHAVGQQGDSTPVAPPPSAPAARDELIGAEVCEAGGGAQEAV